MAGQQRSAPAQIPGWGAPVRGGHDWGCWIQRRLADADAGEGLQSASEAQPAGAA